MKDHSPQIHSLSCCCWLLEVVWHGHMVQRYGYKKMCITIFKLLRDSPSPAICRIQNSKTRPQTDFAVCGQTKLHLCHQDRAKNSAYRCKELLPYQLGNLKTHMAQ